MKRTFLLLFLMLTITLNSDAQRGKRTYYYVVVASYSTLAEARHHNLICPDFDERWIYKAYVNGRTVYRMCVACFTTRAKAQACIRSMRESNAWIWPCNGLAQFVEGPPDYGGDRAELPALRPR